MGRELRMVPADWQHPEDAEGNYTPLKAGSYAVAAARWDEGAAKWADGLRESWDEPRRWVPIEPDCTHYSWAEWTNPRPLAAAYMPNWSDDERTHYMMYEDTSEGTPISPAFASGEELARWLTDTGASAFADFTLDYDGWMSFVNGGSGGLVASRPAEAADHE